MLNNISWQSYWTSIALIATTYYLAVFLIYFRNDFKRSFFQRIAAGGNGHNSMIHPNETESEEKDRTEEYIVYACIDEIKALFDQLKRSKGVKEEILYTLQNLLSKYPTLKNSGYRLTISHVIVSECELNCSIRLSTEDVDHVWIG